MEKRENKLKYYILTIIALIIFFIQFTWMLFGINFGSRVLIGNIFICLISGIAVISSIQVYKKIPPTSPREKFANAFLFFSICLFFLGDLNWLIQESFLNNIFPVGGLSDFLWICAYFCAACAIILFISMGFISSKKDLVLFFFFSLILLGIVVYIDLFKSVFNGAFNFTLMIQDLYVLFDMILLILVVYMLRPLISFGDKSMIYSWILLGLGVFIRMIYDFIFVNFMQSNSYYTGNMIDLFYVGFYLFVILASSVKISYLSRK